MLPGKQVDLTHFHKLERKMVLIQAVPSMEQYLFHCILYLMYFEVYWEILRCLEHLQRGPGTPYCYQAKQQFSGIKLHMMPLDGQSPDKGSLHVGSFEAYGQTAPKDGT